jgi:hypothetical protein
VDRDGEADDPPNPNPHNGQADNLNILDADIQLLINAPDPPSVHAQGSHSLADSMPAASSNVLAGDQNPPNPSKNTSGSAQNYGEGPVMNDDPQNNAATSFQLIPTLLIRQLIALASLH